MNVTAVTLSDEMALVARAMAEPVAFAAIYDHYFPRVYNYVRYRVGDPQTADELTAQVFERALAGIGKYSPQRAPFAAWLFAIARYAVIDHLRARTRRRWLSLDVLRNRADPAPQPESTIIQNEAQTELLASVALLNDRERDILALKFAAGLTNRRIAEITGLSQGNVGVILYRTVRKLRAVLSVKE